MVLGSRNFPYKSVVDRVGSQPFRGGKQIEHLTPQMPLSVPKDCVKRGGKSQLDRCLNDPPAVQCTVQQ